MTSPVVEESPVVPDDDRRVARLGRELKAWLAFRARSAMLLAGHALAFAAVYLAAFSARFDGAIPPWAWATALATLPIVLPLKLAAVIATWGHRAWWRHATFADLVALGEAATLGMLGPVLLSTLWHDTYPIDRPVILLDWAGTLLVLGGARVASRLAREWHLPLLSARSGRPVLIVGADEAGEALVRRIRVSKGLGMRVVGYLDPDPATLGRTLGSVPVLGAPADVLRVAGQHGVETIFAPTPSTPASTIRALVAACAGSTVQVQAVPAVDALLAGHLTVQPRDVDIRDLLGREPVRLDDDAIGGFVGGRVVLVTGAAGSIGSEVCRQVLAYHPSRLILLDHNENGLFYRERELAGLSPGAELVPCIASIRDRARLRAAFEEHMPEVVFHAAAHKHVPMMESNPGEAVKNNVLGTRTLVEEAIRAGVESLVMISTDKAVHPTSVMGACKRLAEMVVQSLAAQSATRLVTVRFGNVLGSAGSVVPIFKEQIRDGGPLTVTHPEMTRYFMTIPEAAQLVIQAGAQGRGGEIFVLDMGEPVKVVDLARDMIRLSGLVEGREIELAFTGLRPGEKLFEELYDEAETRLPTPHPKIFIARHRPCPAGDFEEAIDRLAAVADRTDDEVIVELRRLLPEYRPNRPVSARPALRALPTQPHPRPTTPLPLPPRYVARTAEGHAGAIA